MTNCILDTIDVLLADDTPKTETTAFPAHPGEKPSKTQLKKWVETWKNDLDNNGFGAIMRHELPFELYKLEPQELIDLTGISDDGKKYSAEMKNKDIAHNNKIKKAESDSKLLELRT